MATDLNSICLTGRLTKPAELITQTQTPLCKLSLAVNTGWGDNAKTSFFDVNFWGKGAAGLCQYLTKGKQVAISGSIEQQTWQDRQTGVQRTKYVINTNSVCVMSGDPKGTRGEMYTDAEYSVPSDEGDFTTF